MNIMTKRTTTDEAIYDVQLRREHAIMREVILHLREANRSLLENQQRCLQNLLHAEAALRVYREERLATTTARLNAGRTSCVPGCSKHHWDSERGWQMLRTGFAPEDTCDLTLAK